MSNIICKALYDRLSNWSDQKHVGSIINDGQASITSTSQFNSFWIDIITDITFNKVNTISLHIISQDVGHLKLTSYSNLRNHRALKMFKLYFLVLKL